MKVLKMVMGQDNYFSIADTHVVLDFCKGNLVFINSLPRGAIRKIHVFITNHDSINHHLNELFHRYTDPKNQKPNKVKIIVHIPEYADELVTLFKKFSKDYLNKIQLFIETKDVVFTDVKTERFKVSIIYRPTFLRVKMRFAGLPHMSYKWNDFYYYHEGSMTRENAGIFSNLKVRLNPEDFKDELIEAFKNQAPEGILKGFKSDEEIWDFIMNNARYTMRKE